MATAYRYIREAVDLLAALAPTLAEAILHDIKGDRGAGGTVPGSGRSTTRITSLVKAVTVLHNVTRTGS